MLVAEVDALIIIGSQNSSNSLKLKHIGDKAGIPSILIDNKDELPESFLQDVKKHSEVSQKQRVRGREDFSTGTY